MWAGFSLGYCVLCWFVAFIIVHFVYRPGFVDLAKKTGVPAFLLELVVILMAPFLMPFLVSSSIPCILKIRREIKTLNRIQRTYRPYEFIKVNNLYLDASIREQFEWHTPPLVQLGFNLIGDYRLKPEPVVVHDRVFFSADGETLAAVCALLHSGAVSLISILEDGTVVHTCGVEDPRPDRTFEPADQYVISYMPDTPVEEMHRHHIHVLRECAASHEAGVLRFREEQFRDVLTYDQRLFCRWRYRHGELDQQPPPPDLDSLRREQREPVTP
jgi:hypothetical protein